MRPRCVSIACLLFWISFCYGRVLLTDADALIPGANRGGLYVSFWICNCVLEFKALPFWETLLSRNLVEVALCVHWIRTRVSLLFVESWNLLGLFLCIHSILAHVAFVYYVRISIFSSWEFCCEYINYLEKFPCVQSLKNVPLCMQSCVELYVPGYNCAENFLSCLWLTLSRE